MAENNDITQGWSEHECSVFKLKSFTPPFYLKMTGSICIYCEDESSCFSEGDVFIILQKLKINGVVAIVEGSSPKARQQTQLKIPLDYNGKFYLVSEGSADHVRGETCTLRDIVSDQRLPQRIRLANPQMHGENFLQILQKRDVTLKLSQQTTEEYFLGKSLDGELAFWFSMESNMNFYVKKTIRDDVKNLQFSVRNLKYDIFVGKVGTPIVQSKPTAEVVYACGTPSPRRPSKSLAPSASTTQSAVKSPPPPVPQRQSFSSNSDGSSTSFGLNTGSSIGSKPPGASTRSEVGGNHYTTGTYPNSTAQSKLPELSDSLSSKDFKAIRTRTDIPPNIDWKGGKSGRNLPLPVSPVRPLGQGQINKTNNKAADTAQPPPLPLRAIAEKDKPRHNQLGRGYEGHDTDEEYDKQLAKKPTSPETQCLAPSTQLSGHSANSTRKGNKDYYLTPITPKTRSHPGFEDYPQSSDSENVSDYEDIDSDKSDYELISESTTDSSSADRQGSSLKKKFNFGRKFEVLKLNVKKSRKKSHESGDIADDELTEDPYAEQKFGNRSPKKRQPFQRRRDDPLPMPLESRPSASGQPQPVLPTVTPDRPFLPLPPSHGKHDNFVSDSDDSDKCDYERLDDDDGGGGGGGDTSRLQSPPSRHHPDRPPMPLPPFATHHGRPAHSPKVGKVIPVPAQLTVQEKNEAFPRDLCHLSVEEVTQTLRKLNIPDNTVEAFREAQIDGQMFVCLDDNILEELGVKSLYKLKIMKFKNGWRPHYQSN